MMRNKSNFLVIAAVIAVVCLGLPGSAGAGIIACWDFEGDYLSDVNHVFDGTNLGIDVSITSVAGEYKVGTGGLKIDDNTFSTNYVRVYSNVVNPPYTSVIRTVVCWYRYSDISGDDSHERNFIYETNPNYSLSLGIRDTGMQNKRAQWYFECPGSNYNSATEEGPIVTSGWHHSVLVWNGADDHLKYYHDGELWDYVQIDPNSELEPNQTDFMIGNHRDADGSRNWDGYIDDMAIYDEELNAAEALALYTQTYQGNAINATNVLSYNIQDVNASGPSPRDGDKHLLTDVMLSWNAPMDVTTPLYNVYLGTSASSPLVSSSQSEPNYTPVADLNENTQYYWRIDVNDAGTIYQGKEWILKTVEGLVAWWPFETNVNNAQGNTDYDGTIQGTGVAISSDEVSVGSAALRINDDNSINYVKIANSPFEREQKTASIVGWYRWSDMGADGSDTRKPMFETDDWVVSGEINGDNSNKAEWYWRGSPTFSNTITGPNITEGAWHHIALVYNAVTGRVRFFHDGEIWDDLLGSPGSGLWETTYLNLGSSRHGDGSRNFDGYLDDMAVFDKPLTAEMVRALYYKTAGPNDVLLLSDFKAKNPFPTQGAVKVYTGVVLSWSAPGDVVDPKYNVYFGTSPTPPLVSWDQNETSWDPCGLEEGEVAYNWRVDVNSSGTIYTGDAWSFTTAKGLIAYWPFDSDFANALGPEFPTTPYGGQYTSITNEVNEFKVGTGALKLDSGPLSGNATYVRADGDVVGPTPVVNTVCVWYYFKDISGDGSDTRNFIYETEPTWSLSFGIRNDNLEETFGRKLAQWHFDISTDGDYSNPPDGNITDNNAPPVDEPNDGWHHAAVIWNNVTRRIKFYHDGQIWDDVAIPDVTEIPLNQTGFIIGNHRSGSGSRDWDGYIDDVAIYDLELPASFIAGLYNGTQKHYEPVKAHFPNPANLAIEVETAPTLSWEPGVFTDKHDVYFGTDSAAVESATDPNTLPGRGRQDANSYPPSGPLDLGKTYFWRIDEFNNLHTDVLWEGKVWSFTVKEHVAVIDDMESYDMAGNRIFDTWLDWMVNNTGAEITLETTALDVHRGGKSMKFRSTNYIPPYYSESSRTSPFVNWTANNAEALGIYFKGDPCNVPDVNNRMYVALSDTDAPGNVVVVPYDGDADDIKDATWQHWNIDLEDFNAGGVDLTKVGKIYIGFGDRSNPKTDGSGQSNYVRFDDIRLYPTRCVVDRAYLSLVGDDCMIDGKDLDVLVGGWLLSDYNLPTAAPNDNNLVNWWKFDEGSGTMAYDFTATDNDANFFTDVNTYPAWVDGIVGPNALLFDGFDDFAELKDPLTILGSSFTVTAWVKVPSDASGRVGVILGDYWMPVYVGFSCEIGDSSQDGQMRLYWSGGPDMYGSFDLRDDQWHHLTWVRDKDAGKVYGYVDGLLDIDYTGALTDKFPTGVCRIGRDSRTGDTAFEGTIDDLRIYNYAFSQAEAGYLATLGAGLLYIPLPPEAVEFDFSGDNKINLLDYAEQAEFWLQEQLWP